MLHLNYLYVYVHLTSACVVPMGHNFLTLLVLNKQSINQSFEDIN